MKAAVLHAVGEPMRLEEDTAGRGEGRGGGR